MSQISFSKISAFTETCLTARRPDQITTSLTALLLEAELTSWYVGPLVHESALKPGHGFFGMADGWRKRYGEARHCDHDPVFQHARMGKPPITWAECREKAYYGNASKRALSVFDEAADFGLLDGFVMPTLGTADIVGGVTFGGRQPDLSLEACLNLRLVGTYAYEGLRRFSDGTKKTPPKLTAREREVLHWAAEGKTAWEIGEILKIGSRTVRTHQDNIKEKYGVSSIVQAAVRATLDGTLAAA